MMSLAVSLTASVAACGGGPAEDAGVDAGVSALDRLGAASDGPSEVHAEGGLATSVRGRFTTRDTSAEAARDFLVEHGDAFGVTGPDDLAIREVREDELARVVIFDAVHVGRPVLGAEARVAFAPDGALVHVGAHLPGRLDVAPTPTLDAASATAAAIAATDAEGLVEDTAPVLAVRDPRVLSGAEGAAALVYRVVLRDAAEHRHVVLVDARDGRVLESRVDRFGARARLVEACAVRAGTEACVEAPQTLHDEMGPTVDPGYPLHDRAVRMHALLGEAYAFFADTYGRDSFDDRGSTLRARLVLGVPASSGTLYWDPYGRFVESQRESLETLDFVVHELTHGVIQEHTRVGATELSAGEWLPSEGEAGSLGESLADTFASFATGDWRMEEMDGSVERDLARPRIGHLAAYDEDGSVSALYENSGIPSLAAYLWTEGGTNPSRTGEPAVRGVGMAKTRMVYERAVRMYLTRSTRFDDLRFQLLRACQDLIGRHGIETRDCGELLMAFAAVGIGGWDHDRDTWADDCSTAVDCFVVDDCPPATRDPDEAAASFNPGQEDSDSDGVGDLCEEGPTRDAGVDAGNADAGTGCAGPTLRCAPTYTPASGTTLDLVASPIRQCFARHPTSGWWQAICEYAPPGGGGGAAFSVLYFDSRAHRGNGCIEDGRDPTAPTERFPSPDLRAWVEYIGADRATEDAARRPFADLLLAQLEGHAAACERIDCPASFTDGSGTYTNDALHAFRIPEVSSLRSCASCIYEPGHLSFGAYWAQDPEEQLTCPATPSVIRGRVDDAIVQAYVLYPYSTDPAIEDPRRALATTIFEGIRGRARVCE
jgi:Zn-dependent metalloprotease